MDKVFSDQISKSNIQNVVFVSPKGDDTTGTGDLINPYKTIQRGIDLVPANGTVVIDSGTYTENLTITGGISLKAIAKHTVTVIGKTTINITVNNDRVGFDGINFQNNTDHVISHESANGHELGFYECIITQNGSGAFHGLNITASGGNLLGRNLQCSTQISTGGSRAVFIDSGTNVNVNLFDCLLGIEDNADSVAVELNGTGGFIFVGKNLNGQVLAQGDELVLLAYGGITTTSVAVLHTTMATQPALIVNANVITSANPCVTGTGLFIYTNIIFFQGSHLDYASTLSGGGGAIALPTDGAAGLRYRNLVSGLTATNIQAAIDEIAVNSGNRLLTVNQTGHGLSVGKYIIYDKTTSAWILANTTGVYANGSIAVVSSVIDANNFILKAHGNIVSFTGTAGEFYYVKDDGSGDTTLTVPTNQIQAVLFAIPSNKAIELSYPSMTPGITPVGNAYLGYSRLKLSFSGDQLIVYGEINVNGTALLIDDTITISGATAGWFYVVVDDTGVVTFEVIPVAEIVTDDQQYTPTPPFDTTLNGYYSSVNVTKRIGGIGFWDTVAIVEVIAYGDSTNKNDDIWRSDDIAGGVNATTLNSRLQYISTYSKTRGTGITITDNGSGTTDSEGLRITANRSGRIKINLGIILNANAVDIVANKNGAFFKYFQGGAPAGITEFRFSGMILDVVNEADYFTFYIYSVNTGATIQINQIEAILEEI